MNQDALAVIDDFNFLEERDRLQLLLEFSEKLPELEARFIAVEGNAERVSLHFSAPQEAPTTRGFASVLNAALNNQSAREILDLPDDFPSMLGLDRLISPLRVRGMRGMLARIKRRTREILEADN